MLYRVSEQYTYSRLGRCFHLPAVKPECPTTLFAGSYQGHSHLHARIANKTIASYSGRTGWQYPACMFYSILRLIISSLAGEQCLMSIGWAHRTASSTAVY